MNAREAREITSGVKDNVLTRHEANGYLSAVKKAEPVVSALDVLLREIDKARTQYDEEPWVLFEKLNNFRLLMELFHASASVLATYKKDCLGE